MRLYDVVGWKDTGKTGLAERMASDALDDGLQVPLFDLNDMAGIADFIMEDACL